MAIDCKSLKGRKLSEMTAAEARVAIAMDVIEHLRARRLVARSNVYVQAAAFRDVRSVRATALANLIEEPQACRVCAIGGAFVAAVLRDRAEFADVLLEVGGHNALLPSRLVRELDAWFPMSMLDEIEAAFEGRCIGFCGFLAPWEATQWLPPLVEPELRLVAIMQNIVANGGTFDRSKPPTITRCDGSVVGFEQAVRDAGT